MSTRRAAGSATRLPKTPLLPSSWLSSIADGNVFLKIESVNLTNSFKIRGALNAALRLERRHRQRRRPSSPRRRAITAARWRWPPRSSECRASSSRRRTRPRRSRMRFAVTAPCCIPTARTTTRRSSRPSEFADAEGGIYISPYNHPDVIAGAGTIGLEIVEAMPDLRRRGHSARRRRAGQRHGSGDQGRRSAGHHRRRRGRGVDAVHAEPRSRPHHRDHAAAVARRRPGRQPRAGIDDVRAGEAGRRLRRHRQRRRSRRGR